MPSAALVVSARSRSGPAAARRYVAEMHSLVVVLLAGRLAWGGVAESAVAVPAGRSARLSVEARPPRTLKIDINGRMLGTTPIMNVAVRPVVRSARGPAEDFVDGAYDASVVEFATCAGERRVRDTPSCRRRQASRQSVNRKILRPIPSIHLWYRTRSPSSQPGSTWTSSRRWGVRSGSKTAASASCASGP